MESGHVQSGCRAGVWSASTHGAAIALGYEIYVGLGSWQSWFQSNTIETLFGADTVVFPSMEGSCWWQLLVTSVAKAPGVHAEQSVGVCADEHCVILCCESLRESTVVVEAIEVLSRKGCYSPPQSRPLGTTMWSPAWVIQIASAHFCS